MIKLSVSVMTHPIRRKLIKPLIKSLGGFRDITFVSDDGYDGIWATAKRAWLAYDPKATHHLVLQDDIAVCKNLLDSLPEIIKHVPPLDSISICSNHQASSEAHKQGMTWLRTRNVKHGQALIQPVSQIRDWIAWSDWNVRPDYRLDDGRLEMYLRKHDRWIWNTIPSLVQHVDQGTVEHQIDGTGKRRSPYTAFMYIGDDEDPLSLDWSVGTFMPFTKAGNMRPTERWAIGEGVHEIGRNQINRHAVPDPEAIHIPYDEIMKDYRQTQFDL